MRGFFLRYDDPAVPPRRGVRLRLATDAVAYDLIAPIRCEPLAADGERALRAGLGPEPARRLWRLAVRHLALGRDAGQVVSDPAAPDERWVYQRAACRRCGAAVRVWRLGGRSAYACPVDQPPSARVAALG